MVRDNGEELLMLERSGPHIEYIGLMCRSLAVLAVIGLFLRSETVVAEKHRAAHPLPPPAFERILLPILGEMADGDAYWMTELWARNDGSEPIEAFFPLVCQIGEGCPDLRPFVLQPGQLFYNPGTAAHSAFLTLEKAKAENLSHSLRIENIANLAQSGRSLRGTELPLVREYGFRPAVHLLNIPAEGGGLHKVLRIYELGTDETDVEVELYAVEFDRERLLHQERVHLTGGARIGGFDATPSFALLDLDPLIEAMQSQIPQGRVTVWVRAVDPSVRIWAFVSVFSPETRQMTTITPGR
jgi:hypothetical protein